jgi:hypothetical protein
MSYVIEENGSVRYYSLAKLLDDNPGAALSDPPTAEELAAYNVFEFVITAKPTEDQYDFLTQRLVRKPAEKVDNVYISSWEIVELTEEEKATLQKNLFRGSLSTRDSVELLSDRVSSVESSVGELSGGSSVVAAGWVIDTFIGNKSKVKGCTAVVTSSRQFTVTLDTPFSSLEDYAVVASTTTPHQYAIVDQKSASSFRIRVTDTNGNDLVGLANFSVISLV